METAKLGGLVPPPLVQVLLVELEPQMGLACLGFNKPQILPFQILISVGKLTTLSVPGGLLSFPQQSNDLIYN
ncbi:hypothetical protein NC651_014549 [Populus alba x Populus x berolinensis]|nr:hypothetical protein NC651_014549 [Populus alba x Populus x berolinensis]